MPTVQPAADGRAVKTIGVLVRNSTAKQVGNYRSEAQYDLGPRVEQRGYAVRYYDEQGTSGADLTKRKKAMQMLDDLKAGQIQGIAAYDFKRLTRDEFGMDGATIARRIVEAHAIFQTWDREYNLRLDDDLLQFQFGCFIAGIDWRNIRNTLWSGTFKKLEQEPHYMKTPLGYRNVADDRGKSHVAKNPEHQHVIDALARAFDECDSLAQVARRLNTEGPGRPWFRGRGGTSTHWNVFGLRYILRNTIYTGTFTFGAGLKERSTVWDRFALDPATSTPKDFLQFCPELAYWSIAQVRRWRRKFDKPANARVMKNGSVHALSGVLHCVACGSRMISHGIGKYACSALGSGKGRGGLDCPAPQILTESIVLQVLRRELPNVLVDAQDLAARARTHILEHAPSAAAQRLDFLQERLMSLSDSLTDENTPASALKAVIARIAQTETEIAALRDQVADEEDARLGDEELARTCEVLLRTNTLEVIDHMRPEQQGRVYSMLFAQVRIETQGFAAGRQWRLHSYTARLLDEPRISDWAPWGRLPNPMSKDDAPKDVLVFVDRDERTLATDISERVYVDYLPSLRELAGVLTPA